MVVKILVGAKRVPDPEIKVKVKADGTGIEEQDLTYKLNPFDEIARLQYLSDELAITFNRSRRIEIIKDIMQSQAENLWTIGTVYGPKPIIVSNSLRNVRDAAIWGDGLKHMSAYHPEQFYLKQ